ncbi:MAG: hypothetical protein ABIQ93_16410 [Saprospiraceae bacterium]
MPGYFQILTSENAEAKRPLLKVYFGRCVKMLAGQEYLTLGNAAPGIKKGERQKRKGQKFTYALVAVPVACGLIIF